MPAWDAFKKIAPEDRQSISFKKDKAKIASVLILLTKKEGEWYIPIFLRNTYPGVHSNQIGLPGGQKDKIDNSLKETALRETFEEIGIKKENITKLRALTPLYIPPSNFYVQPYFAKTMGEITFKPDPKEVQELFFLPLQELLQFTINEFTVQQYFNKVKGYKYKEHIVWGATAMILQEFKELLLNDCNINEK